MPGEVWASSIHGDASDSGSIAANTFCLRAMNASRPASSIHNFVYFISVQKALLKSLILKI